MPCPWYRNGVCTSPKLSSPSSHVVVKSRCLGSEAEYKSCHFYVEPEKAQLGSGLEAHLKPASLKDLKPYPPIHLYSKRVESKCPFIKVYEYMGGWVAECTVLRRLLTKSEIDKCNKYWQTCPFYRSAIRAEH